MARSIQERVLICTPSGLPRSDFAEEFLHSLDRETGGGLVRAHRRSNVNLARNEVSARAYARSKAEGRDLWLWIDDDEWGPLREVWEFIARALERWGDDLNGVLLSGIYAQKWRGVTNACVCGPAWKRINGGLPLGVRGGYYPAEWLPGGALLHSLGTFERMTATCPRARYGNSRDEVDGWRVWQTWLSTDEHGVTREAGEDVGFCRVAEQVGIELWLDTRWILAHDGMATFWPADALDASGRHALDEMPRPPWAPKSCADSCDGGAGRPSKPASPPVVEPHRRLVYRFLMLSFPKRIEVSRSLGVEVDFKMSDESIATELFKRAKEQGMLGKLWEETEARHDDPANFNPFENLSPVVELREEQRRVTCP